MRMSKLYMPTLREAPSEAEIPSHQLLVRGGMIRKLVSGIYSYLPLGYRVIRKIENIVREEMDNAGSQELLMSAIQPKELWEASGRWGNYGPEMFKLKDRHMREFCLGPTHEEYFTFVIRDEIKSYKQLPLNLYQIQTKYRDEKRPRFGLIRAREFIMKDAYSFDRDIEGMKKSYKQMWEAYDKIFTRLKIKYKVVEGDSGAMGGNQSHEFMAMSEVGESLVAYCNNCDYAATDEKAKVVYHVEKTDEEMKEIEKVYTPDVTTIDDLVEFFNIDDNKFGKALVYKVSGEPVIAIIPGNRELNETKLCNYLKVPEHELELADEETIKKITGADKGFTGPIGLKENVKILVDSRITQMKNIVVGGNETNYHLINVNYGRDFTGEVVEDLLLIAEGDICPKCGKSILLDRGIEVGNIFQLGTKYSESLKATYLDESGKEKPIVMGSYGVGVSRTMAAIVEQYHDENGIIWPLVVAPYHVIITIINVKNQEQRELGEKLYDQLTKRGLEVLLDDRNERAGVKFNDRDLIGIPIRITVGKRANENVVEYSLRKDGRNENILAEDVMSKIEEQFKKEGLKL
ncbi:prolyl-tRNA synthetase [Keratinibaculum paraultunense]|uniref:Proline--tRNA ligase n=1 Tax=Keratinibaculum paraultunense TaxID=1278232 RepID=A0A4R3KW13_9FIRM|nr:proline--tRNA ligase [Keratinibaculum paraultunense]QQY79438.1 proline--tRNA ligase [Keratinibaculum paraultunense]TCS88069.1 prolyl-tRNA synthetase [Keratinibaculum paraultunense]